MKRTSGGLHKRTIRSVPDAPMGDNERHDETALDVIKNDWHIFRGPPDYTHASLPAIFTNNAKVEANLLEFGIRMTSPYQPFWGNQLTDMNSGLGLSSAYELNGTVGFLTQYL